MAMTIDPRKEDKEEAIKYLTSRIKAEETFSKTLVSLLSKYARLLIAIGYRYRVAPRDFQFSANKDLEKDVNVLIAKMREELRFLLESCVQLGFTKKEDKDDLLVILGKLGNGQQSVNQQMAVYVNRFKFEIEAFIAAGLIANVGKEVVLNHYMANMKTPWTDKLVTSAFKEKGVKAERLRNRGVSYGVGKSNVSFNLLKRIGVGSIAISRWNFESEMFKRREAIGYMQYRGSTYPCEVCDAEARFHPMSDIWMGYPHVHCRCYRVPIFTNDIFF